MKKVLKHILIQLVISVSFVIIWYIINRTGSFLEVGATYLQAYAILVNYGCLVVASNEKDIDKKELSLWALTSVVSSLTAVVIQSGYTGFASALVLGFQVYGIAISVALGYRIRKNSASFKLYEKCICLH